MIEDREDVNIINPLVNSCCVGELFMSEFIEIKKIVDSVKVVNTLATHLLLESMRSDISKRLENPF